MQKLGVLILPLVLTACISAHSKGVGAGYWLTTDNDQNLYTLEREGKQYCCLTHFGYDKHFIVMKLRQWQETGPRTYVLIDKVRDTVHENLSEERYLALRRTLNVPEGLQAQKLRCDNTASNMCS